MILMASGKKCTLKCNSSQFTQNLNFWKILKYPYHYWKLCENYWKQNVLLLKSAKKMPHSYRHPKTSSNDIFNWFWYYQKPAISCWHHCVKCMIARWVEKEKRNFVECWFFQVFGCSCNTIQLFDLLIEKVFYL